MRFGINVEIGEPRKLAELAAEAEKAGWDGIFIADGVSIETKDFPAFPMFDPWVTLAAMAMRTERIRLGTMITPLPRRRPWKLAREVATLDHLSNGRAILAVGLGAAEHDAGFYKVGEAMDLRVRAQRLDEGLQIIAGLWTGKPFSFDGQHYHVQSMTMLPVPVQKPRVPLWVVGVWQKEKSLRRALQYDGIIPQIYKAMRSLTAAEVKALGNYVQEYRPRKEPFDILVGGSTPGKDRKKALKKVQPYAEAGGTWWLEHVCGSPNDPPEQALEKVLTRIRQGPPKAD